MIIEKLMLIVELNEYFSPINESKDNFALKRSVLERHEQYTFERNLEIKKEL